MLSFASLDRRVPHASPSGALCMPGETPQAPLAPTSHPRSRSLVATLELRRHSETAATVSPCPPLLRPPLPRVQFFVRHRGFHTSVLHKESFHTRESLYIIIHSKANWIGVSVCRWTLDCFHFLTAFKDDGVLLLEFLRIYKLRKSVIVGFTTGDYLFCLRKLCLRF